MDDLIVAGIQFHLYWEDVEKNITHLSNLINSISQKVDLIVLPEMFSTGFSIYPQNYLPDNHEQIVISFLEKYSIGRAICGSVIWKHENKYRNRFLFAEDGKITHHYDKKHLFSMGGEHSNFEAGNHQITFEYKTWKIKPIVCYDLRFPVWIRNKENYDLLIVVANWPEKRSLAWKTLLQARAIENQCYVIGINRIGLDGNDIPHSGDSLAITPDGEIQQDAKNEEVIFISTFSKETIKKTRRYLPFLIDMDDFEIKP